MAIFCKYVMLIIFYDWSNTPNDDGAGALETASDEEPVLLELPLPECDCASSSPLLML